MTSAKIPDQAERGPVLLHGVTPAEVHSAALTIVEKLAHDPDGMREILDVLAIKDTLLHLRAHPKPSDKLLGRVASMRSIEIKPPLAHMGDHH